MEITDVFSASNSMHPNIFLGVSDGSAQYRKWYYEVVVDHVEPFVTADATHLRVGWGNTGCYGPYTTGGEGWGGNGVGDDLYSYSFDGLHLLSGEISCMAFTISDETDFTQTLKSLPFSIICPQDAFPNQLTQPVSTF